MKASCGTSTEPIWRIRFLPSLLFEEFLCNIAAVALGDNVLR